MHMRWRAPKSEHLRIQTRQQLCFREGKTAFLKTRPQTAKKLAHNLKTSTCFLVPYQFKLHGVCVIQLFYLNIYCDLRDSLYDVGDSFRSTFKEIMKS